MTPYIKYAFSFCMCTQIPKKVTDTKKKSQIPEKKI